MKRQVVFERREGMTEEEVRQAKIEAEIEARKEETAAAAVITKVAERGRKAEFTDEIKLSDLGKALYLLCSYSSEKGDPLLLLLEGWRCAEAKEHSEEVAMMY